MKNRRRNRLFMLNVLCLSAIYVLLASGCQNSTAVSGTTGDAPQETGGAPAETPAATILYAKMSEEEKQRFVSTEAEKILDQIGGGADNSIPPEGVAAIKTFVDAYARRSGDAKKSADKCGFGDNLSEIFRRGGQYAPLIVSAFDKEAVSPLLGIYTAFNESEFCPCIKSPTGPVGMFQLTSAYARIYGLKAVASDASTEETDERCQPERAAGAAAAHYKKMLEKDFQNETGKVTLAVAAYNSGEGATKQNVKLVRDSTGEENVSFWTLLKHKNDLSQLFQTETSKYVPKFFASAIVGENPKVFGIDAAPLSNETGERGEDVEFWKKQREKALEARNAPTGVDVPGLDIPKELIDTPTAQTEKIKEMRDAGFRVPLDFPDLAEKVLSGELVELPLATENYVLEVGGSSTRDEFTGFDFERGKYPLEKNSEKMNSIKKLAQKLGYDTEKPDDRRMMRIRLLRTLAPQAKPLLEEIAAAYTKEFKRPLRVTSATRSMDYQIDLSRTNPNSYRAAPDTLPPHISGLSFDFAYKNMTAREQNFLMKKLAEMKNNGKIYAFREGGLNAAFHIFVYPEKGAKQ